MKALIFKAFKVSYPLFLLSQKELLTFLILTSFLEKRENYARTPFRFANVISA